MNRKDFVKSALLTSVFSVANPSFLLEGFFSPYKDIILPFPGGKMKRVRILTPKVNFITQAKAQYMSTPYGYYQGYSYGSLAPYQQYYAYQQALAQWQAYYYQQQQYYAWLQSAHFSRMQQLLQQYRNYQIGRPSIWDSIRSMYAYINTGGSQPLFVGLNSSRQRVQIGKTTKAAAAVWDQVDNIYYKAKAEEVTGPQSSEQKATIKLPNNMTLKGKGYITKTGGLGVSDDFVETQDGEVGNLVKYKTGPDNEEYLVI